MINQPFQLLLHLIKQYEKACIELNPTRAYEIAVDISDIALQLEQFAQNLANENNT
jgi:hypothetical protein